MASGSGNVSNVLGLGGTNLDGPSLIIPEGNSQAYFTIYAGGSPGAGSFGIFLKNGVQYQVTSGKTFKGVAIIFSAATASVFFQLASSLTLMAQNAGSIVSGTYQFGAAATYGILIPTAYTQFQQSTTYDFASLSYPCIQTGASGVYSVSIVGKEV